MKKSREIQLAEKIIQLDLLRDELYEELLQTYGWKAQEFLRAVQNHQLVNTASIGELRPEIHAKAQ